VRSVKQSTATNVMILMVDSTDHVTGKASLTLTITASKNGAAFASISPTVTERGSGWYSIALTASHTDTLGDLVIRCTGTGADPAERVLDVTAGLVDADVSSRSTLTQAQARTEADAAIAAVGLTSTVTARIDATISSRLAAASYAAPLDAAGVRTAVGLASANLDTQLMSLDDLDIEVTAIHSRLGAPVGASIAADIAAVKSDTAAVLDDTGATGVVVASGSKSGYALATAPPTSAEVADRVLGRAIAGGADGGRTVGQALAALRNRVARAGSTLTVYAADDTTALWSSTLTTDPTAEPITGADPT
jgi:hypothetical protein